MRNKGKFKRIRKVLRNFRKISIAGSWIIKKIFKIYNWKIQNWKIGMRSMCERYKMKKIKQIMN